ncbi:MAG: diguanylate cyclase domain-containing protein [Cellulosilyticaceae bacterium]
MNLLGKDMSPKTIGVVLGSFEEACQMEILAGMSAYFKQHRINLNIFVGATLEGYASYNGSYTVLAGLISSTKVDGLLFMGGAMANLLSADQLTRFVSQFSHIPSLSISSPIAGIPSLLVDNFSGIAEIVSHLICTHDCKNIAFIGGPAGHDEAICRLEAYAATLEEHNIPINPELIVTGDFSRQAGEDAIRILLDEKGLTDIDAFVCVDDTTAYGALHAIKLRGYSIPNDFYVTGFDDIEEAKSSIPQLTTVRQPFYEMGACGARMLLEHLEGSDIPMYTYYPAQMIIRESCGCFSRAFSIENHSQIMPPLPLPYSTLEANIAHFMESVSSELKYAQFDEAHMLTSIVSLIQRIIHLEDVDDIDFWCDLRNMIYNYLDHQVSLHFWEKLFTFSYEAYMTYSPTKNILYLVKYFFARLHSLLREINLCHEQYLHTEQYLHNFSLRAMSQKLIASFDLPSLLGIIEEGLYSLGIHHCYIGIYPGVLPQNYILSDADLDRMHLIFSYKDDIRLLHQEKQLFSYEQIMPSSCESVRSHLFMPLLFRSEHLGYILFDFDTHVTPNVYETLRSHISSGIKGAFLYQQQQHIQETLHTLSIRDELTGLLNRRGFMTIGSDVFQRSMLSHSDLVLFYLDLDGLKIINDTYGHSEGDHALTSLSELLSRTFRECDLLARLGGDEFVLLTPNLAPSVVPDIITRLQCTIDTFNEGHHTPYKLSTSIGYAMYSPQQHTSLEDMMNVADKHLYKQKKRHHALQFSSKRQE